MKFKYFGDSYDIVKKSLIEWLGDFGDWYAHPMFTESVTPDQSTHFARFLNAKLVSAEELTPKTDRASYFSACQSAGNLFLDPDTGVRLMPRRDSKAINYIFGSELIKLSHARPECLILVFGQSYSRGEQKPQIQEKLAFFATYDVHGFAYCSHATFLVLSANAKLVTRAQCRLLEVSGLPPTRLVTMGAT
jgi:hypothetical protein